MPRLFLSLAVLPLLAGAASAAQPMPLDDRQMDAIAAGTATASGELHLAPATGGGVMSSGIFLFQFSEIDVTNTGTVMLNVDPVSCNTCYLNIIGRDMTTQAQFGPMR